MDNKEIIATYFDRVWNKKDLSVLDEVFAPSAKLRSPLGEFHSPEGMKKIVTNWLNRFPDLHVEQIHLMTDGDLVTSHWQASSKDVKYQGVTMHRLKDGKVVEYWAYTDGI